MDISDRNEQIITTSKPITYLMLALAGLIGGGGAADIDDSPFWGFI